MNRRHKYKDQGKARKTCNATRMRYYQKTQGAINSGQRWSDEETELVMKHEMTDTEISKAIGRSVQAIQLRRYNQMKKEKVNKAIDKAGTKAFEEAKNGIRI